MDWFVGFAAWIQDWENYTINLHKSRWFLKSFELFLWQIFLHLKSFQKTFNLILNGTNQHQSVKSNWFKPKNIHSVKLNWLSLKIYLFTKSAQRAWILKWYVVKLILERITENMKVGIWLNIYDSILDDNRPKKGQCVKRVRWKLNTCRLDSPSLNSEPQESKVPM